MDFERAVNHLLDLHASAIERMHVAEQRMNRAEERMDRAEARMDRTDRQIAGLQKLVKTGMRLIVRIEKRQVQNEDSLNALIAAQLRTDAKIDRLATIWLKRPPNGKGRH